MPLRFGDEPAKRSDAPLLYIEITGPTSRSPSQSLEQMVDKAVIYLTFGAQSCRIVAPAVKGVFVFDRRGHYSFFYEDDMLRGPNTGFELPLSVIFA